MLNLSIYSLHSFGIFSTGKSDTVASVSVCKGSLEVELQKSYVKVDFVEIDLGGYIR